MKHFHRKFKITTSNLTQIEINLLKSLQPNLIFREYISNDTDFLFIYKAFMTAKYLRALEWDIPIIPVEVLYNDDLVQYLQYLLGTKAQSFHSNNKRIGVNFALLDNTGSKNGVTSMIDTKNINFSNSSFNALDKKTSIKHYNSIIRYENMKDILFNNTPLKGLLYTTVDVKDLHFINYLGYLNAVLVNDLTRSVDFVLTSLELKNRTEEILNTIKSTKITFEEIERNTMQNEQIPQSNSIKNEPLNVLPPKLLYALKWNIPIISVDVVFMNDFWNYKKNYKYYKLETEQPNNNFNESLFDDSYLVKENFENDSPCEVCNLERNESYPHHKLNTLKQDVIFNHKKSCRCKLKRKNGFDELKGSNNKSSDNPLYIDLNQGYTSINSQNKSFDNKLQSKKTSTIKDSNDLVSNENNLNHESILFGEDENIHEQSSLINKSSGVFEKISFFLDKALPAKLFNFLKRLIISHKGARVSDFDGCDYILTSILCYQNNLELVKYAQKVLYYHYIFDCVENGVLLISDFYRINIVSQLRILDQFIFVIDQSCKEISREIKNKIKALGGKIDNSENFIHKKTNKKTMEDNYEDYKDNHGSNSFNREIQANGVFGYDNEPRSSLQNSRLDDQIMRNHYYVINNKKTFSAKIPNLFRVVEYNWINACLINKKVVKDDKWLMKKSTLNIIKTDFKKSENFLKKQQSITYLNQRNIVFQSSGVSKALKEVIIKKLKSINIQFLNSDRFENCTHLIVTQINATEKVLCSIASGSWILTPEFIDSFKGSTSMNFAQYEWNTEYVASKYGVEDESHNEFTDKKETKEPQNESKKNILNQEIKLNGKIIITSKQYNAIYQLAESAKYWRNRVKFTGKFAFSDWIVKLYSDDTKAKGVMTLLKAGGAKVFTCLDKEINLKYTHVFVSKNYNDTILENEYYSVNDIFSYLFLKVVF